LLSWGNMKLKIFPITKVKTKQGSYELLKRDYYILTN